VNLFTSQEVLPEYKESLTRRIRRLVTATLHYQQGCTTRRNQTATRIITTRNQMAVGEFLTYHLPDHWSFKFAIKRTYTGNLGPFIWTISLRHFKFRRSWPTSTPTSFASITSICQGRCLINCILQCIFYPSFPPPLPKKL
jgi:hypothetical protein